MEEIRIVDTTLRDGNTSLWAHNMTTGMMHPILHHMDQAGFEAMEFFVSGRFKKVVREGRDDPWEWVRYGHQLKMLGKEDKMGNCVGGNRPGRRRFYSRRGTPAQTTHRSLRWDLLFARFIED